MMKKVRSVFKRSKFGDELQRGNGNLNGDSNLNQLVIAPIYNQRAIDKNEEDITIIWLTCHVENTEEHSLVESLRSINDFIQVSSD